MSDDLEVRFSMSRKRRGSYDAEYMRVVVGLIRDRIGAKSPVRRPGVSKEATRGWLLSYRIGGGAALMGEREGNRKYDHETKLAAVFDHLEHGMSKPEVMGRYNVASRMCLKQWCQDYRHGGPEALRPRSRGRPKGAKPKLKPAPTYKQFLGEESAHLKARVAHLERIHTLLASKPITGRSR